MAWRSSRVRLQPDLTNAPTIATPAMAQAGMILGTAAYMAPEQARGKPVDKRVDIWALGCVLYEMLAGIRAFDGEDVVVVLASVIKGELDWAALPVKCPGANIRCSGAVSRRTAGTGGRHLDGALRARRSDKAHRSG